MRICFLTRKFPPTLSGMSTYALNLGRTLVKRGHDLSVVAQYRPAGVAASCYGDGPPVPLPMARVIGMPQVHETRSGDFESDIEALIEKVVALNEEARFEVIHAQYGYPPGVAAVLAGARLGLPVVVSLQGGDGHWFGTCCNEHFELMKWLLASASTVLYPTDSFRARVDGRYHVPGNHRVISGAVDTGLFKPDPVGRRAWRERLGLSEETLAVIFHGRLDNRKGVRELIEGFAGSSQAQAGACLVVAGIGPDADTLAELARQKIPPSRCRWLGQVPYAEIPELLSAGDLHCSPTYQEGFSNTLVEAAACGLPLLTADAVGVRDVFHHGETAWLVPIESASAVSSGLDEMIRDAELRRQLAERARALVCQAYSWDSLVEELESVYRAGPPVTNSSFPGPSVRNDQCRYRQNPVLL